MDPRQTGKSGTKNSEGVGSRAVGGGSLSILSFSHNNNAVPASVRSSTTETTTVVRRDSSPAPAVPEDPAMTSLQEREKMRRARLTEFVEGQRRDLEAFLQKLWEEEMAERANPRIFANANATTVPITNGGGNISAATGSSISDPPENGRLQMQQQQLKGDLQPPKETIQQQQSRQVSGSSSSSSNSCKISSSKYSSQNNPQQRQRREERLRNAQKANDVLHLRDRLLKEGGSLYEEDGQNQTQLTLQQQRQRNDRQLETMRQDNQLLLQKQQLDSMLQQYLKNKQEEDHQKKHNEQLDLQKRQLEHLLLFQEQQKRMALSYQFLNETRSSLHQLQQRQDFEPPSSLHTAAITGREEGQGGGGIFSTKIRKNETDQLKEMISRKQFHIAQIEEQAKLLRQHDPNSYNSKRNSVPLRTVTAAGPAASVSFPLPKSSIVVPATSTRQKQALLPAKHLPKVLPPNDVSCASRKTLEKEKQQKQQREKSIAIDDETTTTKAATTASSKSFGCGGSVVSARQTNADAVVPATDVVNTAFLYSPIPPPHLVQKNGKKRSLTAVERMARLLSKKEEMSEKEIEEESKLDMTSVLEEYASLLDGLCDENSSSLSNNKIIHNPPSRRFSKTQIEALMIEFEKEITVRVDQESVTSFIGYRRALALRTTSIRKRRNLSEAEIMNSAHVFSTRFRSKFLRAEGYDAKKGAQRYLSCLDLLFRFFGDDGLKRDPYFSDLRRSNDGKDTVEKKSCLGYGKWPLVQLLPSRDAILGRRIIVAYINPNELVRLQRPLSKDCGDDTDNENDRNGGFDTSSVIHRIVRMILLLMMTIVSEDEPTQNHGYIGMCYFYELIQHYLFSNSASVYILLIVDKY